jgi:hypothetical protein
MLGNYKPCWYGSLRIVAELPLRQHLGPHQGAGIRDPGEISGLEINNPCGGTGAIRLEWRRAWIKRGGSLHQTCARPLFGNVLEKIGIGSGLDESCAKPAGDLICCAPSFSVARMAGHEITCRRSTHVHQRCKVPPARPELVQQIHS